MKLLIIDDSQADRELLIRYLNREEDTKINIDESHCLTDAIEKIHSNNYDAILLDLILPESNGINTVKIIKNKIDESNKNIPIIVLTGYEDYSIGREAFNLGIKDFLIKGEVNRKDISRSVKFAIQSSKSRQISSHIA